MHRSDKATLRLAAGLGLAALIAYGWALTAPYVVCVMAVLLLAKPGPALPLAKGLVLAVLMGVLVAAGLLMVPLLENYAASGVLLTAVILFSLFYKGLVDSNPLITILVITFAVIPVAGVLEQALVSQLALSLAIGVAVGTVVSFLTSALFPDPPILESAAGPEPAASDDVAIAHNTARWIALRATVIVMPVFLLALSNPSAYMAAIMKTVALGQQAGETDSRSAGRELVGSTCMGAISRACPVARTVTVAQSVDVDPVADGRRPVDGRRHDRRAPHAPAPVILEQCAGHRPDPVRARHRRQRQRQKRAPGRTHAHNAVHCSLVLRLGHHLAARALARRALD